ncbi:MAG: hypothetical protein B6D44_09800 [Ignavibacteriales bacterium UTCHB2]|nr:MAG: hypothetical protein B6D44_09800 [Ignavibacteriales bacterium UTCHB2]
MNILVKREYFHQEKCFIPKRIFQKTEIKSHFISPNIDTLSSNDKQIVNFFYLYAFINGMMIGHVSSIDQHQ